MGASQKYKNKGNWGYDSNAWFFETANAASIGYRIARDGYKAVYSILKNISRYL